jgi:putative mycofactocin binding protein MftB
MEFDLQRAWGLERQVALRPEPFGALAYHFGTRRLSFLKTRKLVDVVRGLSDHPSGLEACQAAGVTEGELPDYERALHRLAGAGMLVERSAP